MELKIEITLEGKTIARTAWNPVTNPGMLDALLAVAGAEQDPPQPKRKPKRTVPQRTPWANGTIDASVMRQPERRKATKRMRAADVEVAIDLLAEGCACHEVAEAMGSTLEAIKALCGGRSWVRISGFTPWDDRNPRDPWSRKYLNRNGDGTKTKEARALISRFQTAYLAHQRKNAAEARAVKARKNK